MVERALLAASALRLIKPGAGTDVVGLLLLGACVFWQRRQVGRQHAGRVAPAAAGSEAG